MSCNLGDVTDMGVNARPDLLVPGPKDPGGGPSSSSGECDRTVEKFGPCDVVLTVLAMIGYLSDLGSDIFVAFMHYGHRNYWWFGLTVSFMVLPSLTVAAFSFAWYINDWKEFRGKGDGTRRWIIRYIFVFLQLAPLMRQVGLLIQYIGFSIGFSSHIRTLNPCNCLKDLLKTLQKWIDFLWVHEF